MKSGNAKNRSMTALNVGGIGLCVFCTALTCIGTTSAVGALNRSYADGARYEQPIAYVASTDDESDSKVGKTVDEGDQASDVPDKDDSSGSVQDYVSEQHDWAGKYHITWDSDGNPISESGDVMNDPTTSVNEVARAIANGTSTADGMSIEWLRQNDPDYEFVDEGTSEEVSDGLYQGVDSISRTADGKYVYTVQPGDSMLRIASRCGVSVEDIMDLNDIANSNIIFTGEQFILPSDGITDGASGAGLG